MKSEDVKKLVTLAGNNDVEVHVLGAQQAFKGKIKMASQVGGGTEILHVGGSQGSPAVFISVEHIVAIAG